MELKLGPRTRARMKKLKASNGNEDNGMFLIGSLLEFLNFKILNRGSSREEGDPWEEVDSKLHSKCIYIKVVLEQPPIEGFIMSMEGQFPTQSHQEGTSDPSRMNLNETFSFVESSMCGLSVSGCLRFYVA
ncbi:hypothetical protein M9H77_31125 [Catharanthus roseus]|uniref:Uncharacterized protein n=1 Tax=Catharanthus roseus TaxID=4058 RepID=A0ACB9ZZ53_CATRO|nr:hypothetical protein M9H77_31125 [Catharanthus roseus]